MAPPDQPPDRIDSQHQDETQEREPVQSRRTASTNDLNYDNLPQAIRLADGPGSGSLLINRERLSGNVRRRAGLGSWTEAPPQSSETRRTDIEGLLRDYEARQRIQEATQAITNQRTLMAAAQRQRAAATPDPDAPRENTSSRERTEVPEVTLEPRLAPAVFQDTPLNSTQQPDQPGQPRSYMPSLRSQPEFYMTGVTTVDTTAKPLADNAECTICLEPLSDDVVKFHACGHMFHTVCVQSWFDQSAPRTGNKRGTCPNCRHELYEPDPRYGRTAPLQNVERPVVSAPRRRFALTPSGGEVDSRREEFIASFRQRLEGEQQNTGAEQAPAVTPQPLAVTLQPLAVTRRPRGTPRGWGELTRGYQLPRTDALERARDDPPARGDTAGIHPRTSSLPHGGAARRQQASQVMTDAVRATASPRASHAGDERVDPGESDDVPDVDESPRTPSMPLERPSAPTPTVNRHPVRPRESRATLAARAIAGRRPLVQEPGLNNGDADPPRPVQLPVLNSQHTASNRSRDSLPLGTPVGAYQLNMENPGGMAGRSTRDLQDEQNSLLDRLREVQNQIGRNLQEAETPRERRANAAIRPAQNHLPRGVQDDMSTRRPPPTAIPHLADPTVSDLRSAREFPDRRVIGSGTSIWSADHVAPTGRDTWAGHTRSGILSGTQASQTRRFSLLPSHLNNAVTADTLAGVTNNNDRTPSFPGSTHSETSSAEQPASGDNQRSILEDRQLIQNLRRQLDDMRRLVSDGFSVAPFLGPAPTDDDAPEALQ